MQTDPVEHRLRELMLSSLDGDAAAYRSLLAELCRHLRPYFTRWLTPAFASHAEDLVQETLLAVHARRITYDRDRPFTAWLHAVAHHKFVDHVRRQSIRLTVSLDDDMQIFAHDDSFDALIRRDLDVVLDTVPERTSDLIRRTRIAGETMAEAAAAHGISETAAKVSVHRGLRALMGRFAGGTR